MKLFNSIKPHHFFLILLIITIIVIGFYFLKRLNKGIVSEGLNNDIKTDSNLVTTINPYLIPPETALGRSNTLVMQWKDEISTKINFINTMFDSNGVLKPDYVTMLKENIVKSVKAGNPNIPDEQINSVVTPQLITQNLRKDYIKVFLDNVIDLATIIKQGLN
jgi:hypothetical protein